MHRQKYTDFCNLKSNENVSQFNSLILFVSWTVILGVSSAVWEFNNNLSGSVRCKTSLRDIGLQLSFQSQLVSLLQWYFLSKNLQNMSICVLINLFSVLKICLHFVYIKWVKIFSKRSGFIHIFNVTNGTCIHWNSKMTPIPTNQLLLPTTKNTGAFPLPLPTRCCLQQIRPL